MTEENKDIIDTEDNAGDDDTTTIDLDSENKDEIIEKLKQKLDTTTRQLETTIHQKKAWKEKYDKKEVEKKEVTKTEFDSSTELQLVSFLTRNKDLDAEDGEFALRLSKTGVTLADVRKDPIFEAYLNAKKEKSKQEGAQLGASKGSQTTQTPSPTSNPDKHRSFAEQKAKEILARK